MDFYEPLQRIRDYFVLVKEPAKAELVNLILSGLDDVNNKTLPLTKDEVQELVNFIYAAGYISYEHHAGIHSLCKKMEEFLRKTND